MVVVPTEENVVIEFEDTWAESGGKLLTFGGVTSLAVVGGLLYWRRRVSSSGETLAS
jgi:LPXTG-motif cell wall-anchored protein